MKLMGSRIHERHSNNSSLIPYDIVVSDIKMPHINGFKLCRKIKAKEARVRVYLLSAFDIYAKEAETIFPTLGSTVFIKKPIRYQELAAILSQKS